MRKLMYPLAVAAAAAMFTPAIAHAAPQCDPAHPAAGCATPTTEPRQAGPLPTTKKYPDQCGAGQWGELEADNKWHCYANNTGPPSTPCPPPAAWIDGACVAHPPKPPPSEVDKAPGSGGPITRSPVPPPPPPPPPGVPHI
jgi:hypothetical protein